MQCFFSVLTSVIEWLLVRLKLITSITVSPPYRMRPHDYNHQDVIIRSVVLIPGYCLQSLVQDPVVHCSRLHSGDILGTSRCFRRIGVVSTVVSSGTGSCSLGGNCGLLWSSPYSSNESKAMGFSFQQSRFYVLESFPQCLSA